MPASPSRWWSAVRSQCNAMHSEQPLLPQIASSWRNIHSCAYVIQRRLWRWQEPAYRDEGQPFAPHGAHIWQKQTFAISINAHLLTCSLAQLLTCSLAGLSDQKLLTTRRLESTTTEAQGRHETSDSEDEQSSCSLFILSASVSSATSYCFKTARANRPR